MKIVIPPPIDVMTELGDEKRHFMDQFVPRSNRLVAGFVNAGDLGSIQVGAIKAPSQIAFAATSREYESKEIDQAYFKLIVESAAKDFDATVDNYAKENQDSFEQRLKTLKLDDVHITFSQPVSLGCLFQTPDSAAFGTILQVAGSNGETNSSLTKAVSVIFSSGAKSCIVCVFLCGL